MINLREYGSPPFRVAVIHGGPGAAGGMAPVARELSSLGGVLEPLQTAASVVGQVAELKDCLVANANLPVALVGWSWGAWLALITAARHPSLVSKLLLVGSGPFAASYAEGIMATRLARLSPEERETARTLAERLDDPAADGRDGALTRLGALIAKADAYDPLPRQGEGTSARHDIYTAVWREASELRRSGRLLELAAGVRCPVVAIHGDHDPHPAEGVRAPLAAVVRDFTFVLLARCGHEPWAERQAGSRFYTIVREILSENRSPSEPT